MADPITETSPYLETAISAAAAIRSTARETEAGLAWLPDPDQPDRLTTEGAPQTLYSGGAGVVIFLLELASATGDQAILREAHLGAKEIAATWPQVLEHDNHIPTPNPALDFYTGLSGTVFTLTKAWQATGDEVLKEAALAIVAHITGAAREAGAGVEWLGQPSISVGDGAIVLTLLALANDLDAPELSDLATRAGRRMLERATPDSRGGSRWINLVYAELMGVPGSYMPNFDAGTAGVAYVLARLYDRTGDTAFLEAAIAGAEHLQTIATVTDDSALIFYREPDYPDLYYLGWCQGPVGTVRTFYELHRLTGNAGYGDFANKLARGVSSSGIPERQAPGLWNVVCQCCGTAGVLDLFLGLWHGLGDPHHLAFARRVGDSLVQRADRSGAGARWYQAWHRTNPDLIAAETGYMIGDAGVGSALLHLHLAENGVLPAILFPDNPFPSQSQS